MRRNQFSELDDEQVYTHQDAVETHQQQEEVRVKRPPLTGTVRFPAQVPQPQYRPKQASREEPVQEEEHHVEGSHRQVVYREVESQPHTSESRRGRGGRGGKTFEEPRYRPKNQSHHEDEQPLQYSQSEGSNAKAHNYRAVTRKDIPEGDGTEEVHHNDRRQGYYRQYEPRQFQKREDSLKGAEYEQKSYGRGERRQQKSYNDYPADDHYAEQEQTRYARRGDRQGGYQQYQPKGAAHAHEETVPQAKSGEAEEVYYNDETYYHRDKQHENYRGGQQEGGYRQKRHYDDYPRADYHEKPHYKQREEHDELGQSQSDPSHYRPRGRGGYSRGGYQKQYDEGYHNDEDRGYPRRGGRGRGRGYQRTEEDYNHKDHADQAVEETEAPAQEERKAWPKDDEHRPYRKEHRDYEERDGEYRGRSERGRGRGNRGHYNEGGHRNQGDDEHRPKYQWPEDTPEVKEGTTTATPAEGQEAKGEEHKEHKDRGDKKRDDRKKGEKKPWREDGETIEAEVEPEGPTYAEFKKKQDELKKNLQKKEARGHDALVTKQVEKVEKVKEKQQQIGSQIKNIDTYNTGVAKTKEEANLLAFKPPSDDEGDGGERPRRRFGDDKFGESRGGFRGDRGRGGFRGDRGGFRGGFEGGRGRGGDVQRGGFRGGEKRGGYGGDKAQRTGGLQFSADAFPAL